MYCLWCGTRLTATYFAALDKPVSAAGASVSTLRGALGEAVNDAMLADETILYETEGVSGEGVTITSQRVLISKAGMAAAGGLKARRVGAFQLEEVQDVQLVVGTRMLRLQVMASGFPAVDQDGGRVELQYPTLLRQLNTCHLALDRRAALEEALAVAPAAAADAPVVEAHPHTQLDALLQAGILTPDEYAGAL